jgi:hypothetical protein
MENKLYMYLSDQLTQSYGRGWSAKQLRHCLRLAEAFPEDKMCRQLSWSHL